MLDDLDLSSITDERMRTLIVRLLNIIEDQAAALREVQVEIQRLCDETNRLRGEQGKPPTPPTPPTNYSSGPERYRPVERGKRGKRQPITIDREQTLTVDRSLLPPDAEFKGYEQVVVQDIVIRTDNVRFWKEVFYAISIGRSYRAPLPPGYQGQFGPGIHTLVLVLAYGCLASEAKIRELLTNVGVQIADGTISNLLIKDQDAFHTEAEAILQAELGARQRVRKRDVSFGPRSAEGAKAWGTFLSLADTTRKLGVSFYHYIHDRIRGDGQIPPLAYLIATRAEELNLGASWAPAS